MQRDYVHGALHLVVAALLFGTMGVLVRLLDAHTGPFSQVFLRVAVAAAALVILTSISGHKVPRVSGRAAVVYLVAGWLGYGAMLVAFTLSILHTTIANAFFLLFTAPLFVMLLSWIFLREEPARTEVVAAALVVVGIYLIFNPGNLIHNLHGNLLGLAAGMLYGGYLTCSRYVGRTYSSLFSTTITLALSLAILAPLAFFLEDPRAWLMLQPMAWGLIAAFAAVNLTSYFLINSGLRRVKATTGSLILSIEPIAASVFAFAFFHELPGLGAWIGGAIVLAGVGLLTIYGMKRTA